MTGHIEVFDLAFRIVFDDDLQRPQDRHRPGRAGIEVFTDAELQQSDVNHVLALGHANLVAEAANRLGREAPAPQT